MVEHCEKWGDCRVIKFNVGKCVAIRKLGRARDNPGDIDRLPEELVNHEPEANADTTEDPNLIMYNEIIPVKKNGKLFRHSIKW